MIKRDLVIRIADETKLRQQDVLAVIQKMLTYITDTLAEGENVEFRDFGVWQIRVRKSRPGRNPRKPEQTVIIPARRVVKFKMGRIMKQRVMKVVEPTPAVAPAAGPAKP